MEKRQVLFFNEVTKIEVFYIEKIKFVLFFTKPQKNMSDTWK